MPTCEQHQLSGTWIPPANTNNYYMQGHLRGRYCNSSSHGLHAYTAVEIIIVV